MQCWPRVSVPKSQPLGVCLGSELRCFAWVLSLALILLCRAGVLSILWRTELGSGGRGLAEGHTKKAESRRTFPVDLAHSVHWRCQSLIIHKLPCSSFFLIIKFVLFFSTFFLFPFN